MAMLMSAAVTAVNWERAARWGSVRVSRVGGGGAAMVVVEVVWRCSGALRCWRTCPDVGTSLAAAA